MTPVIPRCAVVGRGRLGTALAAALPGAAGPLGRGASAQDADVVLLAVPDAAIADAAAHVAPGRLVGHCSGATTLAPLAPHEAFSLHPLMTVTRSAEKRAPSLFFGAGCAVAGSTPRALETAFAPAERLGMGAGGTDDAHPAPHH